MVLIMNYGHPFSRSQLDRLAQLLDQDPEVRTIDVQVARTLPLEDVAAALADPASLSAAEWQTTPLVFNPPGLAPVAAALLAEIHGCSGQFPAMVHIRPIPDSIPTCYEVSELINMQRLCNAGARRFSSPPAPRSTS